MPNAGEVIRASDVSVQACRVMRTTAQAIPAGSFEVVVFDEELYDTDGMHSFVPANMSRITINAAGIYVIGFTGMLEAASTYVRTFTTLRANGVTALARNQNPGTSTSVQQTLFVSTQYQFEVGDYIEVQVFQDSGGAKDLEVTADRSPHFYAARIGS